MYKFFSLLLIIIFGNSLLAQGKVKIIGETNSDANGQYLYVGYDDPGLKDSVLISGNKFEYDLEIKEPIYFYLSKNKDFYHSDTDNKVFYIEPDTVKFQFDYADLSSIRISGVKTEDEREKLRILRKPLNQLMKENNEKLQKLNNEIKEVGKNESLQKEIEKRWFKSDSIKFEIAKSGVEFALTHPDSYLSPDLLIWGMYNKNADEISEMIYSASGSLTEKIKQSSRGKGLFEIIPSFKQSRNGVMAPDFSVLDINSDSQILSQFKGNYVLLDFWASWCRPCLDDLPYLHEINKKYQNSGLKIIGISEDENLEKWINAIDKFETNQWIQISIKQNEIDLKANYLITAIPVKILIGPDGKIIKRWRGGGEPNHRDLNQTLENLLGF